ncbi:MAG: 2,3-bisphosphoglycerate-independent phosphoglycerate mutase [Clostridia bacterium]|nr:2,3-bisphosphoglycerate-independent phosphoglycerate mutase [Clostridia bacterium]
MKPIVLIIMDGYGLSKKRKGNAINSATSPYVKYLAKNYPCTTLNASGLAVGLPDGQMGNSEVGHLNLGAGRVVYQDLTRISKSIDDGDFFANDQLVGACNHVKQTNGKLHLFGLLSDGGVHSHTKHLYALINLAKQQGLSQVYVHCFLDGRDVLPTSATGYIAQLQDYCNQLQFGKIASVSGRYYAMDRDKRWERVQKAYDVIALGKGEQTTNPVDYVKQSYAQGVTDEFVVPAAVVEDGQCVATVQNGDAIVFFNFRPDRARELTAAFTQDSFNGFDLGGKKRNVHFVCMKQYDETFQNVQVAFKPETLVNTLGEYLSKCGKRQFRIAETEKYAHVTFFFNGGVEAPNANEVREIIASPKVATYDLQPQMSAIEVCNRLKAVLLKERYDFVVVNFANCDMVGHTGVIDATQQAVLTVDDCVRQVVETTLTAGGIAFVTADHGNAEKMLDDKGNVFTAHTTNPVPFIMVDTANRNATLMEGGALCDVAPTLLQVMGLEVPTEMTGKSLLLAD